MKQVYKIDEHGYYIEPVIADKEILSSDFVETPPPQGLYRAQWTGTEWIEDMTQEEIDALNNQPILPTQEDRIDMLENIILMMMEG